MNYYFIHSNKRVAIDTDDEGNSRLFVDEVLDEAAEVGGMSPTELEERARTILRAYYQEFFRRQLKNLVVLSGAGTSIGVGEGGEQGSVDG